MGNLWAPGDENTPNQTFKLTQDIVVACLWQFIDANWFIELLHTAPASRLQVFYQGLPQPWFDKTEAAGKWYWKNPLVNPIGKHYHSGEAIAGWFLKDEPGWLQLCMDNLNIIGSDNLKNEIFPVDADTAIALFADQQESTNILIEHDI